MDMEYLLALQNLRESLPAAVGAIANAVTMLGIALPLAIAVLAYWIFDRRLGLTVLASFTFGNFIVQTTKLFCCVYRPWILDGRIVPYEGAVAGATGYSFPSGHSAMAASSCGGVAWGWRGRRAVCICFVLLALLCGFTRNFLGVHTPQDVLAGLLVGAVAVALAAVIVPWLEKGGNRDICFAAVCAVLGIGAMIVFSVKSYPLDYVNGTLVADPAIMARDAFKGAGVLIGFAAGYLFERRVVRGGSAMPGWSGRAIGLALLGAALGGGLYLLASALGSAFLPATATSFLKISVLLFFAVGIWPAAMQRLVRRGLDEVAESGKRAELSGFDCPDEPAASVAPDECVGQPAAFGVSAGSAESSCPTEPKTQVVERVERADPATSDPGTQAADFAARGALHGSVAPGGFHASDALAASDTSNGFDASRPPR